MKLTEAINSLIEIRDEIERRGEDPSETELVVTGHIGKSEFETGIDTIAYVITPQSGGVIQWVKKNVQIGV